MQRILEAAIVLLIVGFPAAVDAQSNPASTLAPAANPKDVASPEAIVGALYDVLSGTGQQPRDWDRFRSLFIADGRLIPTGVDRQGRANLRPLTADAYAKIVEPQLKGEGFYEREISRTADSFGSIMHVFSTYESRHAVTDAQPFGRGINSIELFHDGARWWIISVLWDRERANNPIPAKYLPASKGGNRLR
jgi:hypothetical protein